MKLTVEIPDSVFRRVQAIAASKGRSVEDIFLAALRNELRQDALPKAARGWRVAFGAARAEDVAKVQRIIDDEFSTI